MTAIFSKRFGTRRRVRIGGARGSVSPVFWTCCSLLWLTAYPLSANAQVRDTVATTATRWQPIYSDENLTILVDAQTNRVQNESVARLWTDWRYAVLQRMQNGSNYEHVKALVEVNCTSREFRELRSAYFLRGSPVFERSSSQQRDEGAEWIEPIPDSVGEALLQGVCFWLGR
jgi:hypothetical protein